MAIRECQVSFFDQRGIRHSVAVYASAVLEAAAAGLKQFRETEMIGDEGVEDLTVEFPAGHGRKVHAVSGISIDVAEGETLGLVGESGCGKTTLARTMLGLERPTGGQVRYQGSPLSYRNSALRTYRRAVQLVLQDPTGSLNPRHTVYEAIAEGVNDAGLDEIARRHSMEIVGPVPEGYI